MNKLARNVVLPVVLVTALFACDKGKGGSGGSGGGATGVAGASAIAPAQGGLKRALAAMPKETELIVGIDFQSLRKSAVFKKYEPMIMEKVGKDLEEFKTKCGFDPMEKLTGLLFGAQIDPGGGDGISNGTFFVRGFEKGPAIECIKKAAAEKAAEGDTANIDGDYIELLEQGVPKFRALFIDDTTALFIKQGDGFADKAGLQAAAAAKEGDGLTASAAFVKLLDEVKTGSSMWMVMNGNAKVMQQNPLPFKIKAIFGWVNVAAGVDGESRVRMEDKDAAAAMVGFSKMGMDEAKKTPYAKLVEAIKVTSKGDDVVVTFKFDQKQIDEMVEMAKSSPF